MKLLDELGVSYIEAGIPASNPKDAELFACLAEIKLKHAKIAAFGSTHRIGVPVEQDSAVKALIDAGTPVVTIFGKAWDLSLIHIWICLSANCRKDMVFIIISCLCVCSGRFTAVRPVRYAAEESVKEQAWQLLAM